MRFFEVEEVFGADGKIAGMHAGREIVGHLPDYGKPFMQRKRGPVRRDGKQSHYLCYDVPRTRQTLRLMFRDPKRSAVTPRGGKSELIASCAGVLLFKEQRGKTCADILSDQCGHGVKYVIHPPHSIGFYAFSLASAMRSYGIEVAKSWSNL